MGTCTENCDRKATRRGLCGLHYQRAKKAGTIPTIQSPCSVEGCSDLSWSRGWCNKHYSKWRKYGDPNHAISCPHGLTPDAQLRFYGWTVTESDCWEGLNLLSDKDGYLAFSREGKSLRAHRLAYETWVGPIPEGHVVRHKCDNPPCINPDHLETGTVADNNRDRSMRGRNNPAQGESHRSAKLTEQDVFDIRSEYATGQITQKALAEFYGVSRSLVGLVVNHDRWKHID